MSHNWGSYPRKTCDRKGETMTVREMMKLLEGYPGDLRVVVNGYEDGYDDLSPGQISVVRIALNTGVHDWEGRHGDADESNGDADEPAATANALVLCRESY